MNDKCEAFYNLLNEYIDGIMIPEDKQELQNHLDSCKMCSDELVELETTVKTIKGLKLIEPHPARDSFSQEIISKLQHEQNTGKLHFLKPFRYIAAGLLATGLVAFILFNLHSGTLHQTDNRIVEAYASDFRTFISDNEVSLISESGLPTDDYGLLMLDGSN